MMLRIWAGKGMRSYENCSFCRQQIVWVTTDAGKSIPLDRDFRAEIQQQDDHGRCFELVESGARHRCERRGR